MNAFSVPGAESTSAALCRVEQERDEAREALYTATWERDTARAELASARAEIERLRAGWDPYPNPSCGKPTGNASNRCLRAPGHDGWCDDDPPVLPYRELERVRAELVSAHQELDALRTVRDRLDAALDHTRQQLGDAVQELMDWGVFGIPGASNPPEGAPPA